MNWKCLILLLTASTALAIEDPPNCSVANGGEGNTSFGGVNFVQTQAHVGDTVSLVATLGMISNACRAINATGSIWIATGHLVNFFDNVTLEPHTFSGIDDYCPVGTNVACQPGPYSFVITAPMVGASVTSPLGSVSGIAKRVRAIENGTGTVNSGPVNEQLTDFHSTSTLVIVTPCLQVFEMCGQSCTGGNVNFTGYVLNCGDITMTNINVVNDRVPTLLNLDGTTLSQPFTLTSGSTKPFKGSFTPSAPEVSSASATNSMTVTGTDTTTIGGPRASVTNSVTTVCSITSCNNCFCWCPP